MFGSRAALLSGGFNPKNIQGLQLWLDASQIAGLSDGAAVASWTDLSGLGNHATQGTGSKQPLYKVGQFGGLPGVKFDGVDDFLTGGSFDVSPGYTLCVVATMASLPATSSFLSIGSGTAALDRVQWQYLSTGVVVCYAEANAGNLYVGRKTASAALSTGTAALWRATYDGGTAASGIVIRRNGTQVDTTNDNAGAFTGVPAGVKPVYLASDAGGTVPFGAMTVAEVLIWLRALTASEGGQVDRYLGAKYGLAVS